MKRQPKRNLLDRAGLWETRAQQAAAKGDYERAGRLRTKASKLSEQAKKIKGDR